MSELFTSPNDIKLLSDLINLGRENDSSDDEEHVAKKSTNTYFTPADIAKQKPAPPKQETQRSPYEKIETPKVLTELDYEDECLGKIEELNVEATWKTTPQWEITYRQAVTASDVFLQMGNKTPATASCENMIVTIDLPGEKSGSIDLKIRHTEVKLTSSKYFLKMPLPHPVDPQLGNAKFDGDTDKLIVTLVMNREFDFVNY